MVVEIEDLIGFPHVRYINSLEKHEEKIVFKKYIGRDYNFSSNPVECRWMSYSPDKNTARKDILVAIDVNGKYVHVNRDFER